MRILDVAYPPEPALLVSDLQALGAGGCAGYVVDLALNPPTTWTPAHAQALRAAGLVFLAIVVPGNSPPAADGCWGWWDGQGPIALDLEAGSEPAGAWVQAWIAAVRQRGGSPGLYGGSAIQSAYGGLDWGWRWLADWTFVEPAAPPAGFQAVQWTDRMTVGGRRYDGSVFDPIVFGGGDLTPEEHDTLQQVRDALARFEAGQDAPAQLITAILQRLDQQVIPALQQLAKASVPGDLAQLQADVAAITAAVARIETALKGA
jgi:hypothetical protein